MTERTKVLGCINFMEPSRLKPVLLPVLQSGLLSIVSEHQKEGEGTVFHPCCVSEVIEWIV